MVRRLAVRRHDRVRAGVCAATANGDHHHDSGESSGGISATTTPVVGEGGESRVDDNRDPGLPAAGEARAKAG